MNVRKHNMVGLVVFAALCLWIVFSGNGKQSCDIIIYNGRIFLAKNTLVFVEAVALNNNMIIDSGNNEDILQYSSAKTRKIDLKGETIQLPSMEITRSAKSAVNSSNTVSQTSFAAY